MTEFIENRSILREAACGCKATLLIKTFGANIAESAVEFVPCGTNNPQHNDAVEKEFHLKDK